MNKVTWIALAVVVVLAVGGFFYLRTYGTQHLVEISDSAVDSTTLDRDYHDNIYLVRNDAQKGGYVTDFAGMTLYIYGNDTVGVSMCTGECESRWKPYTSGATAQGTMPQHVSVITRPDGSEQFAWDGMPLYYFTGEQNPGEILGDGMEGVWHIVRM
jgi:predicted lipoprotein with Yx(FWY)xxD motif